MCFRKLCLLLQALVFSNNVYTPLVVISVFLFGIFPLRKQIVNVSELCEFEI